MTFTLGQTNEAAGGATSPVIDATTQSFETDVLRASRERPIVVDFWAPWCGPCRQLTPLLEKVIGATKGKVRLVKVNIDENPDLAQALRVQSIPTVYAFLDGRPVDAFMGALPESQLKQFVDRLLKAAPGTEEEGIEAALAEAKQAEDEGDLAGAAEIYAALLEHDGELAAAHAGLLRTVLATGDVAGARTRLATLPESVAKDPAITAVRTQLDLAEQAAKSGPLDDLEAKVARDPADHAARLELALGLYAAGRLEQAVDALLESIRRDRGWNDGEARKQLVKFFEAWGPADPLTIQGRRKLSSILFS
jgi:putative thioredoxin